MGDHDDRQSVVLIELSQDTQDDLTGLVIQVAGGFVSKQERGVCDQSSSDRRALHFPTREFPWAVFHAVRQAHHIDQVLGALDHQPSVSQVGEQTVGDHCRCKDVFKESQFGQEVVELKNHSELLIAKRIAIASRQAIDPLAVEGDFACIGLVESSEQMQQGAFS